MKIYNTDQGKCKSCNKNAKVAWELRTTIYLCIECYLRAIKSFVSHLPEIEEKYNNILLNIENTKNHIMVAKENVPTINRKIKVK